MVFKAICTLAGDGVKGVLHFTQEKNGPVKITGHVEGIAKGQHGFHVHEFGDVTNGCISAGEHWNPFNKNHGGPNDEDRHLGDLGNISVGSDGCGKISMTDNIMSLTGPYSIVGRTMVLHADEDDLGKGGHLDSKISGHAGGRIACGVIGFEAGSELPQM